MILKLNLFNLHFFKQKILVVSTLLEWENRLKIGYEIFDELNHKKLTKGYTVQVAVEADTHVLCLQSPDVFLEKVNAYLSKNNQEMRQ